MCHYELCIQTHCKISFYTGLCPFLAFLICYHYRPQPSCGKVMFLYLSLILSGGVYPSIHWGTDTPPGRHPSWADIPPGQTPPGRHPLPSRRLLQQTVRIILECILVVSIILENAHETLTPSVNGFLIFAFMSTPKMQRCVNASCVILCVYHRHNVNVITFKDYSHGTIATPICLSQPMGCMGYSVVVTITPCEHWHWIQYKPFIVMRKIEVAIASCE